MELSMKTFNQIITNLFLTDWFFYDRFLQSMPLGWPDPHAAGYGFLGHSRQLPVGGIGHNGGDHHVHVLSGGRHCLVLMGRDLTRNTIEF